MEGTRAKKGRRSAWMIGVGIALAAGCASFRWYGSNKDLSPEARFPKPKPEVRFYSDLGPDKIDVSTYPEEQQRNYAVFARACSQCHNLARSINSPMADRDSWNFYVSSMHIQTYFRTEVKLSDSDMKAVVDFLAFDSKIRKIDGKKDFDLLTDRLRAQYQSLLDKELKKL